MNVEDLKIVEDINGVEYHIDKLLGQGGQGAVYKLKDNNLALKILTKNNEILQDVRFHKVFNETFNDILIKKIPGDINLCKPLTTLKEPYTGYIMKVLNNIKPIDNLLYANETQPIEDFLNKTYGLNKRYLILKELARTMARLHSLGMVYCDLSPSNVFCSSLNQYSKIWLIDCDNIKFTNEVKSCIYTPGYGAPEVELHRSVNTIYSDCFSFAVLAFKLLTNCTPFIKSESDESVGWDETTVSDNENSIYSSEYHPWIFMNASKEQKQYFCQMIDKNLMKLFQRTFSEEGYFNNISRPSMQEWYDALKKLCLKITVCNHCGNYILSGNNTCIFCNEALVHRIIGQLSVIYKKDKTIIDNVLDELNIDDKELKKELVKVTHKKLYSFAIYNGMIIYDDVVDNFSINRMPNQLLKFVYNDNNVLVKNLSNREVLFGNGKKSIKPSESMIIEKRIEHFYIKNMNKFDDNIDYYVIGVVING